MARLISCVKCGRIHEENKCNVKTVETSRKRVTGKYRADRRWYYARRQALERDFYCCRMCLDKDNYVEREGLEVHHIIPIYKNASMVYDTNNLITLCKRHHRMVEGNSRYTDYLHKLITSDVQFKL